MLMWLLDNSHWLIAGLGLLHLLAFVALYLWRAHQVRELRMFLSNLVRGFTQRSDLGLLDVDDEINSFVTDVGQVLADPQRRNDRTALKQRLEIKDEIRPYLKTVRTETFYNVARTGIEAYPLLGILCTILAMGVGMNAAPPAAENAAAPTGVVAPPAPTVDPAPAANTVQIVRAFRAAIWSTAAGLIVAIVLMIVNALVGPSLDRLQEHRQQVREMIFSARKHLGIETANAQQAEVPADSVEHG
jgi:biopolymer transport protein ExbB/TolQ